MKRIFAILFMIAAMLGGWSALQPAVAAPDDVSVSGEVKTTTESLKPDVNVDVDDDDSAWYVNPWVIGGAIAAILVIALIAAASRGRDGGGTTIIKT
jgi:hypothetical protein